MFWSSIWDNEVGRNRQAEWLNQVKEKLNHEKKQNLMIAKGKTAQQSKKNANWKAPGLMEFRDNHIRLKIFQLAIKGSHTNLMEPLMATTYLNGYKFRTGQVNINHSLFMDNLKSFGKNEPHIDPQVKIIHLFTEDIGMKFGTLKCRVLVM